MGKLENWLDRHRPRFRIAESIKTGFEKLRASTHNVTDLADIVKVEGDNRSLRHQVGELQAIIAELKKPPVPDEPGTIYLTRRPGEMARPAQDLANDMAQKRLPALNDEILIATLHDVRRQLASSDGIGVQLKTRLGIINGQLLAATEALGKGDMLRVEQLLVDARRTSTLESLRVPKTNRDAIHFDDSVQKPNPPATRDQIV